MFSNFLKWEQNHYQSTLPPFSLSLHSSPHSLPTLSLSLSEAKLPSMAVSPFFLFLTLTFTLTSSTSDVDLLLHKVKPSFQSTLLTSWNTSVPLCQWRGLKWSFSGGAPVTCSDVTSPQWSNLSLHADPSLHLLSLQLPSANLSGTLPPEIGDFAGLKSLYLSYNSISGRIPVELGYGSSLSDIDLSHNLLSGSVPVSVWNLCDGDKLVSVRVHGNLLSGSIPEPGLPNATCNGLAYFDFGANNFPGGIRGFVSGLTGLKELDLGGNGLTGSVPDGLTRLGLEKLNLSHNNLTGVLPGPMVVRFGSGSFENNPDLCVSGCERSSGGLSSGAVAGIVISLMTGVVVFASLLIGYVQGKKRGGVSDEEGEEFEDEGGEGKPIPSRKETNMCKKTG